MLTTKPAGSANPRYCHECHPSYFGICEKCGYKILIGLVVVMVIVSYMAWFGVVL